LFAVRLIVPITGTPAKRDPRFGHIPILILTGEGAMDQRLEGVDVGADDYVSKPVDPRELSARVRALLELSRRGMDRNPSSGLPGGRAIDREFGRRRDAGAAFAVCYLDLDGFKPFGERFGFAVSDAVIASLGDLLGRISQDADTFAAHVGGNDFIVFCDSDVARAQVSRLQSLFRERVATLVPADVVAAGSYIGKDRSGIERRFPLTAVSAAVLHVSPDYTGSLQDLGEIVADVMEQAKRQGPGGVIEVRLPGDR
jgi:GGDEF domain-containing protein